ncbi:hypothetical protein T492DRAFT_992322, partial [Pavlovales sp. CCMP2436]
MQSRSAPRCRFMVTTSLLVLAGLPAGRPFAHGQTQIRVPRTALPPRPALTIEGSAVPTSVRTSELRVQGLGAHVRTDGFGAVAPRRRVLQAATAAVATCGGASAAQGSTLQNVEALVWRQPAASDEAAKTSQGWLCTPQGSRRAFGPRFVNYLARFLLAYDTPSRRMWRARAAEIPLSWSEERVEAARTAQFGEFTGAIESGLCAFAPVRGNWGIPMTAVDTASVRRLLSLLRSRYGKRNDALRQLALLFTLLPPEAQPTSSIEQLGASAEQRAARGIVVIDGGSLVLAREGAPYLPPPALVTPAAPVAGGARAAARAAPPQLHATGRVLVVSLEGGGRGYADTELPPLVTIAPPGDCGKGGEARLCRTATATAIVRGGSVVSLELIDGGSGYSEADPPPAVTIAPPPSSAQRWVRASARALLELEVGSVALLSPGAGYGSSQDLDVRFFERGSFNTSEDGGASVSRRGLLQPAAAATQVLVLRPPRAMLVLDALGTGAGARAYARARSPVAQEQVKTRKVNARGGGGRWVLGQVKRAESGGEPESPVASTWPQPAPPAPPAGSRSDGGGLFRKICLLPLEEGFPVFDPGRPGVGRRPGVPAQHRFPSAIFENALTLAKTPLGGTVVLRGLDALPTSLSGGVRQDVPLTPVLVARLALAGGLCSMVTRAATTPLDLRKTQAQAAARKSTPGPGAAHGDAGHAISPTTAEHTTATAIPAEHTVAVKCATAPPTTAATAATAAATAMQAPAAVESTLVPAAAAAAPVTFAVAAPAAAVTPGGDWLGLDAAAAAGFAMGAGSFGTYEYLKRSLPVFALLLGPA